MFECLKEFIEKIDKLRRRIESRAPAFLRSPESLLTGEPAESGPSFAEGRRGLRPSSWQKHLTGILRARHCDPALPDDPALALSDAAERLQSVGQSLVRESIGELVDQVRVATSSEAVAMMTNRLERLENRLLALRDEWRDEWENVRKAMDHTMSEDPVGDMAIKQIQEDAKKLKDIIEVLDDSSGLPSGPLQWNTFAGAEVALGALEEIRRLMDVLQYSGDPQTRADALWKAFNNSITESGVRGQGRRNSRGVRRTGHGTSGRGRKSPGH